MERIVLLCLVSTCLLAVHAQRFVFSPKWVSVGFKEREVRNDLTPMDEIIKANENHAPQFIDSTSSLRDGDIAVSTGKRSKACFARVCLWSKSVDGFVYVAYRFSPNYTELETKMIKKGMETIERSSCVRFVPRTHQEDFVDIKPKSGCWSYLGSRGGRQTLSLQNPDCLRVGVITHEIMHALGFVHEQSRYDRDKYVTVMWPNIWRDRVRNFEKFRTDTLDLPYDYSSVMHFGTYSYSQRGEPTIVPKNNNVRLGQATPLSRIDKMKINKLYDCDDMD